MKTKLLLLLSVFVLMSFRVFSQDNQKVDEVIEGFMKKWDIPGGAFTMAYDGKIIYSKGYGFANTESKEPVTNKSLFRIASCSKPFTAVCIMKLIEEGKLNLNDKVFGPKGILNQMEFQDIKDKRVLDIEIVNLLEHTAGWDSKIEGDPMFMSIQIAEAEHVKAPAMQVPIVEYVLSEMMLNHDPGTAYAYSNFGYCVLGRVIEKVTGMTYGAFVRENVLSKCGSGSMQLGRNLENEKFTDEVTYYGCPGEMTTKSVYNSNETVPWPYGGFNIEAMDSHGQWIASSDDLVNFLIAVGNNSLISQSSYDIMTSPPNIPKDNYAKGWAVNSGNIFHTGSLPGTVSEIVKATDGYAWALVFNKRNNNVMIYNDLDKLGWTVQEFLK